MAHIVILGAGLGGVSMAYDMRAAAKKNDKITVISDSPNYHFVPSNPWVAVNWRSREQIEIPLEPYFSKKNIELIPVAAKRVDPAGNAIELIDGRRVEYDYLVISTGPALAFDEVPGLGPNGNTSSVCHINHAVKAADEWEQFCADPGPVIVGAVQGASCYGPAYEHCFIIDRDLRKRRVRDRVPMTFVTAEPYIGHLGLGGVGNSRGMLEAELRKRDIKWICNAKVDKVEPGMMHVTEVDDNAEPKKSHELPFKHSMMLPAFRGVDAVRDVEGLVNPRGFVLVDEFQRNPNYKNVFGVGVCIAIPPMEKTPLPVGTPKTGYMIESMVDATAHNIMEAIDGKEPTHRASWNAICLADMGNTGVAFVALPQNPPRNVAWMRGGVWVHWLKLLFEWYFLRKVRKGSISPFYEIYLLKLLGISKRKAHAK